MFGKVHWDKAKELSDAMLKELDIKPPPCGFYVGPGWMPPVRRALEKMIEAGWDKDLHQVKQKFCRLRIYIDHKLFSTNKELHDKLGAIIADAADECDQICEFCGMKREKQGMGVGLALCNKCKGEE